MKNLYQTPRELIIRQDVWNKGKPLGGNSNTEIYRMDAFGAVMKWDAYNMPQHKYAWTMDFLDGNPENTVLANLAPVYWKNKRTGLQPEDVPANIFYAFDNQEKQNSRLLVVDRRT